MQKMHTPNQNDYCDLILGLISVIDPSRFLFLRGGMPLDRETLCIFGPGGSYRASSRRVSAGHWRRVSPYQHIIHHNATQSTMILE